MASLSAKLKMTFTDGKSKTVPMDPPVTLRSIQGEIQAAIRQVNRDDAVLSKVEITIVVEKD